MSDWTGTGSVITGTQVYCSVAQLKARLEIGDTDDDTVLGQVIDGVQRWIEQYTGRRFYTTGEDETRYFTADGCECIWPGDVVSITTLATDPTGHRTYSYEWAATDYDLIPHNAALSGEPYTKIQVTPAGNHVFPIIEKGVKIVGKFGWSAVPDAVREACLLQSARLWKRVDAPFGVAGAAELGQMLVIPQLDPDVKALLNPYRTMRGRRV